MEYYPSDIEKAAINLVQREKEAWQEGEIYITSKMWFRMRNILQRGRKNYWGIFDEPYDSATGREKIWVPLTEWSVDTIVRNVDIDTKDINIKALRPSSIGSAILMRHLLKHYLRLMNFGQFLNDLEVAMAIDGSGVVKVYDEYDKFAKRIIPQLKVVDLLNWYIDPAAFDIQSASAVIERAIVITDEVKETYKDEWENLEYLKGVSDIVSLPDSISLTKSEVPQSDIYERWGKMPKYFLTGKDKDKDIWADGRIVISGLDYNKPIAHLIAANKSGIKPYEECWLKRVPNRWHGRGTGEMLLMIQKYLNTVVNIRINNMYILQHGLFKIKKNRGITPQLLSGLAAGGAVPVMDMDDIQDLRTQDIKPSSYKDEATAYDWAERQLSTYPVARGEAPSPSQTATASVITAQKAGSTFDLIRENLGLFLERLIERHIIPKILDSVKNGEIVRISGEPKELKELDEVVVNNLLGETIKNYNKKNNAYPSQAEVEAEKERVANTFKKLGRDRYLKLQKEAMSTKYDVDIYVTAEKLDPSVLTRQLTDLLAYYGRFTGGTIDVDSVVAEILDILGLSGERFIKKEEQPLTPIASMPKGMPGQSQMPSRENFVPRTEQNVFARAAQIQGVGRAAQPQ